MKSLIELLPTRSDEELKQIRINALANSRAGKNVERAEALLDAIDAEIAARGIPGLIERFRQEFPGGFYEKPSSTQERNYKDKASKMCRDLFAREAFGRLLDERDWIELIGRFKRVVTATNFHQPQYERPRLLDAVADPVRTEPFFTALYDDLWGEADSPVRFDQFCRALARLNMAKWTYATYARFLMNPEHDMFVKPAMLKKCIEISGHYLAYESTPSARRYGQIIEFSRWLKRAIAPLEPQDMIDVHTFMWFMAPTGKHAVE